MRRECAANDGDLADGIGKLHGRLQRRAVAKNECVSAGRGRPRRVNAKSTHVPGTQDPPFQPTRIASADTEVGLLIAKDDLFISDINKISFFKDEIIKLPYK